ncbi:expressed unknown protein [Ectocarpus siliculosus]|uniref:Uncharacterized protein n=1 Tax=Ectocarpus siliculosus TaxID=2880 RepID=D7FWW2_ECTSI|nr:expressed unknown protein [Ectocarpus siliculosus]|eukprot:CBJ32200.1 expressed unknown protein [Ectocarpus siliculosus]
MASVSSSILYDNTSEHKRRLAGKLIYSTGSLVAAVVAEIVVLNLIIEVASTLTAVDDWGADTREAMIKLEQGGFLAAGVRDLDGGKGLRKSGPSQGPRGSDAGQFCRHRHKLRARLQLRREHAVVQEV